MTHRASPRTTSLSGADRLWLTALFLLIGLTCASPAGAAELSVPLRARETLVLQVPDGWTHQIRRPVPELPPTIALSSPQPLGFRVLITPIWPAPGAGAWTAEAIRRQVEGGARQAAARSVERELPVREFSASGRTGYFFSATDRDAGPTGYTHLTQGSMGYEDLRLTFTILSNGQPDAVVGQAMTVLRTLKRVRDPGAV